MSNAHLKCVVSQVAPHPTYHQLGTGHTMINDIECLTEVRELHDTVFPIIHEKQECTQSTEKISKTLAPTMEAMLSVMQEMLAGEMTRDGISNDTLKHLEVRFMGR